MKLEKRLKSQLTDFEKKILIDYEYEKCADELVKIYLII